MTTKSKITTKTQAPALSPVSPRSSSVPKGPVVSVNPRHQPSSPKKGEAAKLTSSLSVKHSDRTRSVSPSAPNKVEAGVQQEPVVSVQKAAKVLNEKVLKEAHQEITPYKKTINDHKAAKAEKNLDSEPKVNDAKENVDTTNQCKLTENMTADVTEQPVNGVNAKGIDIALVEIPTLSNEYPSVDSQEKGNTENNEQQGYVVFEWSATNAKSVFLAGDFNEWQHNSLPMAKMNDKFVANVALGTGKHFYKFVVDGKWFYDMTKPNEMDANGNVNNVMVVE